MKYDKLSLMELTALLGSYQAANKPIPGELSAALAAKKKANIPADPKPDEEDEDEETAGEEDDEDEKPMSSGSKPGDFTQVASLVPKGQHFVEEAFSNEGVWITGEHLVAIENRLRSQNAAVRTKTAALVAAKAELTASEQALEEANESVESLTAENGKLKQADGPRKVAAPKKAADPKIGSQREVPLSEQKTSWDLEIDAQRNLVKTP